MNDKPNTIRFKNGDRYKGEVNAQGQPHGEGCMAYHDKSEYIGQWENGKRCGKGRFRYPYWGYDYEGDWFDDKEHGQGVAKYHSSDLNHNGPGTTVTNTGSFRDGKLHGHIVVVDKSWDKNAGAYATNRFEGEFKDGDKNGHGVWEYANGIRFEGEFTNGKKNGHGVYTFTNGIKFKGDWKDNQLITESYQLDPSLEDPMLIVTERHIVNDGIPSFGSFLIIAQKGMIKYKDATEIDREYFSLLSYSSSDYYLTILEATPDSVTYEVKSKFITDADNASKETIRRGETKEHTGFTTYSHSYEDETWDDEHKDTLEVICL